MQREMRERERQTCLIACLEVEGYIKKEAFGRPHLVDRRERCEARRYEGHRGPNQVTLLNDRV